MIVIYVLLLVVFPILLLMGLDRVDAPPAMNGLLTTLACVFSTMLILMLTGMV